MKILMLFFVACILPLPSAAEAGAIKSTEAVSMRGQQQALAEPGYVSEQDFERILNEAEDTFRKNKPKGGKSFLDISVGLISKQAREEIGLGNFVHKHPDRAIKLLDKEIELDPGNFGSYDWRARAYREKCSGYNPKLEMHPERKQFCEKALTDFNKVISLTKDDTARAGYLLVKPEAYRQKGMVYETMGDKESALKAYNEALKLEKPEHGDFIYHNRAKLLISMGRYEEAINDLKLYFNSRVEKYSKKHLAFFPCQKLLKAGYQVEGCPEKSTLETMDQEGYWKMLMKEREKEYAEKKKNK